MASRYRNFALAAILCICSSSAWAQEALERGLSMLANDVALRRNNSPVQTFFIGIYEQPNYGYKWRIYWPEARMLFWVEEGDDRVVSEAPLLVSKVFDMETGVVNTTGEIGSSTYLNDAAWAREQIKRAMSGRSFTVAVSVAKPAAAVEAR